jgi:hypothetical protein
MNDISVLARSALASRILSVREYTHSFAAEESLNLFDLKIVRNFLSLLPGKVKPASEESPQ